MAAGASLLDRQRCRWHSRRHLGEIYSYCVASPYSWRIDSLGRYSIFMLKSFPFCICIGIALGVLSGLGTGGGSLLILWLTLIMHIPPTDARTINLLFFIPSAVIACLFHWKQGRLEIKKVLPAIIAGSIASGSFTFLSQRITIDVFRKLFGILLLLTGVRELLYKPKQQ